MALAAARAASRTPTYVPHRQMLPSSPLRISSTVGFGVLVEERLARGDEAGRAVAAHQAVVLVEGVGHAVLAGVEALERLDRLALARDGQRGAGIDRVAVDDRRAGAAARAIADPLGAGHVEPVAQRVEQRAARLDRAGAILAVDLERDLDRAGEDLRSRPRRPGPRRAGRSPGRSGRPWPPPRPSPARSRAGCGRRPAGFSGFLFSHRANLPFHFAPTSTSTRESAPPGARPPHRVTTTAKPNPIEQYTTPRPARRQESGSPDQAGVSVLGSNRSNAPAIEHHHAAPARPGGWRRPWRPSPSGRTRSPRRQRRPGPRRLPAAARG